MTHSKLSYYVSRPTRTEKLYKADLAIYFFHDGTVEFGKNKNGSLGQLDLHDSIYIIFQRFLPK